MLFWWASTQSPSPELQQALHQAGFAFWRRPLVQQVAATLDDPLRQALAWSERATWRVFVSPFAVQATAALAPTLLRQGLLAAVGVSTRDEILSINPQVQVLTPIAGSGLQALWESLALRINPDDSVAIFCAPDGVASLHDVLLARGHGCQNVWVYQRQAVPLSSAETHELAAHGDALWIYAGAASHLPEHPISPARNTVFVPSVRVADLAQARGFRDVIVLAEDKSLLSAVRLTIQSRQAQQA